MSIRDAPVTQEQLQAAFAGMVLSDGPADPVRTGSKFRPLAAPLWGAG